MKNITINRSVKFTAPILLLTLEMFSIKFIILSKIFTALELKSDVQPALNFCKFHFDPLKIKDP